MCLSLVYPLSADDVYHVKKKCVGPTDDENSVMTGSVRVQCTAQPVPLPCVSASTPRGAETFSRAQSAFQCSLPLEKLTQGWRSLTHIS